MKAGNTVARNATWLIAQPILVGIISVVVTALVARDLGAGNYGTLLLLLSYVTLFSQITNLGLRPYSVREIASNHLRTIEIVSDMLVLRALLALGTMVLALLVFKFLDQTLDAFLIGTLFLQLVFNALSGCFIDGLQGREHMKAVATSFALSGVFVQLACVASLQLDLGLHGVAGAYTLGALAMLLLVWRQFHSIVGKCTFRRPGDWHTLHLRNSLVFLLQNLVGVVRGRLDLVLINSMMGVRIAGIYGSAMVLIQRLDLVQDGIATAVYSRVAFLQGTDAVGLHKLVCAVLKVLLVISTPMAVGLLFVSGDIIELMFGNQFRESGGVLSVLGLAIPFMFIGGVKFNVLRAMGYEQVVLRTTILSAAVTLLFLVVGITLFGLWGACVAFLLGSASQALLFLYRYQAAMGRAIKGRELFQLAIANAAMAMFLWMFAGQGLMLKVLGAAAIFACAIRLQGLVTIDMVKAMFSRDTAG